MKGAQEDKLHRVQAVRAWLERAESSFAKEADIKGELNLMLAEAEMKNLRRHHGRRETVLRLLALITALCFLIAVYWLKVSEKPQPVWQSKVPVQEAAPAAAPVPALSTKEAVPASAPLPETAAAETVPEKPAAPPPAPVPETAAVPVQTHAETSQPVLTKQQMQDTVQAARHTLRSTEITNQ